MFWRRSVDEAEVVLGAREINFDIAATGRYEEDLRLLFIDLRCCKHRLETQADGWPVTSL